MGVRAPPNAHDSNLLGAKGVSRAGPLLGDSAIGGLLFGHLFSAASAPPRDILVPLATDRLLASSVAMRRRRLACPTHLVPHEVGSRFRDVLWGSPTTHAHSSQLHCHSAPRLVARAGAFLHRLRAGVWWRILFEGRPSWCAPLGGVAPSCTHICGGLIRAWLLPWRRPLWGPVGVL